MRLGAEEMARIEEEGAWRGSALREVAEKATVEASALHHSPVRVGASNVMLLQNNPRKCSNKYFEY